jgi:hypothetical protein
MATKPEDALSADEMKVNGESDYSKHFEMAGIEEEATPNAGDQDAEAKSKTEGEKGKGPEAKPDASAGGGDDASSKSTLEAQGKEDKGKASNPGDLTLADGTVVKAGAERRHYEGLQVEKQRSADLTNQVKQMTTSRDNWRERYTGLEAQVKSLHGADPETVSVGIRMASDLKADPIGTVKKLVAECLAAGYTIEQLGEGIDTAAIKRMIDERLPQPQQQQDNSAQIEQEVAQEVAQFFNAFPDAKVHEATLARVMSDHPELDLRTAYFELKQAFIAKGFDWNKPLNAQDVAASSVTQNKSSEGPAMVNGRAVSADPATKTVIAAAHTDTGDIVREAMREAGMNI